jgi:plastocyanin
MKWYHLWILSLVGLFLPAVTFGGEGPSKIGIVKGTITIGGRPTSEAVVSVEGLSKEYLKSQISSLKPKPAVMDQQDLKFLPHVLPVVVGTSVEFANNDKTFHNVFSTSEAKKFDLGLYSPGRRRSVTFDKAGLVRILCHVHPNMEAYIFVVGHPYFSAADTRGNYQIKAVPLGKYRLEVWHPEFGTKVVTFDLVREGEVLGIDIDLKKK